ncbi:Xaa-Pro aminopeptidase [Aliidiomarina indica]|uniref:Xaa-Pro aminopeptidase n=1 Tax=Aliidiomarina indica TaxID=2749147 RepID=UPI00189068DA|nr:Xaa-Pro aminopeptidase [Aliidiomarina indica]
MPQAAEYQKRRQAFMQSMNSQGVAIFPAASEVIRSRDTHFPFRQDSDFFYLTGINEPDAVLVLMPDTETPEVLFVLPRDAHAEVWHGRRLGCDKAQEISGVSHCYSLDTLDVQLPDFLNGSEHLYFAFDQFPKFEADLREHLRNLRSAPKRTKTAPAHWHDSRPHVHQQRLIKSEAEIALMQQAADISVTAHKRAMQSVQPGVFEYQIDALLSHEFMHQGGSGPAYGSIVGGGENACILHYTANTDVLKDGDLLLIDAGCEYQGYAADITRTFPVNGKFSRAQRAIYELVLAAQEAAFALIKPGSSLPKAQDAAVKVLTEGLLHLGILKGSVQQHLDEQSCRRFFIHGLGHWLGLDVHDVGTYQTDGIPIKLQPGMVLTIEPGLYFAPDDDSVPEQYRGMGIRIEDDLLVTKDGYCNLTAGVPKSVEGIEALMASGHRDRATTRPQRNEDSQRASR